MSPSWRGSWRPPAASATRHRPVTRVLRQDGPAHTQPARMASTDGLWPRAYLGRRLVVRGNVERTPWCRKGRDEHAEVADLPDRHAPFRSGQLQSRADGRSALGTLTPGSSTTDPLGRVTPHCRAVVCPDDRSTI